MTVIRGWLMPDFPDLTLDDLAGILDCVSADCGHETRARVAMGIKHEFGEDGFSAWSSWYRNAPKWTESELNSIWKSCKGSGAKGTVTIGSVINLAKEKGWTRERRELSAAEKRQMKKDQEARRLKRQAELEADQARLLAMQQQVQAATMRLLAEYTKPRGKSDYLARKQVSAFGVHFITRPVVLSIDDQLQRCDLWAGDDIKRFFDSLPNPRPDHHSFMMLKPGTFIVPLADIDGVIWSFQSISPSGTKLFPKYARKSECMHCIGSLEDAEVIALAEGYSTSASCFMATEWALVMTVDVGNMAKVARLLRARYPNAKLVLAGDDDPKPDGKNPGRTQAEAVGAELGVVVAFPRVPSQKVAA